MTSATSQPPSEGAAASRDDLLAVDWDDVRRGAAASPALAAGAGAGLPPDPDQDLPEEARDAVHARQLAEFRNALEVERARSAALTADLRSASRDRTRIAQQRDEERGESARMAQEVNRLSEDLARVTAERDALREEVERVSRERDALQQEVTSAGEMIERLGEEIEGHDREEAPS